jgi:hypothetical protein
VSQQHFLTWLDKNCSELHPDLREYIASGAEEVYGKTYSQKIKKVDIPDTELKGEHTRDDQKRTRHLQEAVELLMKDRKFRTLPEIQDALGFGTQTSIYARLNEAVYAGRATKEKRLRTRGVYEYRLLQGASHVHFAGGAFSFKAKHRKSAKRSE